MPIHAHTTTLADASRQLDPDQPDAFTPSSTHSANVIDQLRRLDAVWGAKVRLRTNLQADAGGGGGAAGESAVASCSGGGSGGTQAVAMGAGSGTAATVVVNCAAGATSAVTLGGGSEDRTGKGRKRTAPGVSTALETVLASLARSAEALTAMMAATMQRPYPFSPPNASAYGPATYGPGPATYGPDPATYGPPNAHGQPPAHAYGQPSAGAYGQSNAGAYGPPTAISGALGMSSTGAHSQQDASACVSSSASFSSSSSSSSGSAPQIEMQWACRTCLVVLTDFDQYESHVRQCLPSQQRGRSATSSAAALQAAGAVSQVAALSLPQLVMAPSPSLPQLVMAPSSSLLAAPSSHASGGAASAEEEEEENASGPERSTESLERDALAKMAQEVMAPDSEPGFGRDKEGQRITSAPPKKRKKVNW